MFFFASFCNHRWVYAYGEMSWIEIYIRDMPLSSYRWKFSLNACCVFIYFCLYWIKLVCYQSLGMKCVKIKIFAFWKTWLLFNTSQNNIPSPIVIFSFASHTNSHEITQTRSFILHDYFHIPQHADGMSWKCSIFAGVWLCNRIFNRKCLSYHPAVIKLSLSDFIVRWEFLFIADKWQHIKSSESASPSLIEAQINTTIWQ